jgi:hypothetical protein
MRKPVPFAATLLLAALTLPGSRAAPPTLPAFDRHDPLASLRLLQHSPTPAARAIARQITKGPRALAAERAAARRAGMPLTPAQLEEGALPKALNAAPVYERLARVLKATPLDTRASQAALRLGRDGAATAEDLATARRLLAGRADVMALVLQATDRPRCGFRHDWSHGPPVLLYEPLRAATRLLTTRSYLLAAGGHGPEAIATQARGFRVAEHASADPFLIGRLVALALDRLTLGGFANLLYLAGSDREAAREIQRAISVARPRFDFRRTLEGETVYGLVSLEELRRGGPSKLEEWVSLNVDLDGDGSSRKSGATPRKLTPAERRSWNRFVDAGEAEYLRRMRRVIASVKTPYRLRQALFRQWIARDTAQSNDPVAALSTESLSIIAATDTAGMRARAQEEAVMAGAALLAYHAGHGAFPDRLEQALPVAPLDPFSGRPLRYRREGEGFVVYSVGADGRFEGGSAGARIGGRESLFRYPAPHQPALPSPTGGLP